VIIESLRAENVLKYARLELESFPARGKIAISGPNESGKTAVVETICFALFGRTFSVGEEQVEKAIRWGESHCCVELQFANGDDHYVVSRTLDQTGTHAATLKRAGDDEPLATGPEAVQEMISDLCGYGYREYLDALYLAQREISRPRSQSSTIKAIAGGADLEAVAADIREDISDERSAINELREQITAIGHEIAELGIEEGAVAALEERQAALRLEIKGDQKEISGLEDASHRMQDACTHMQEIGGRYAVAGFDTSLGQWREYSGQLADAMRSIAGACEVLDTDNDLCTGDHLKQYLWEFEGRIAGFGGVQERIDVYRADLGAQFGEQGETEQPAGKDSLPAARDGLSGRAGRMRLLGGLLQALFLLTALAAMAGGTGWWMLDVDSATGYQGMASAWLEANAPWWNETFTPWLKTSSIIAGIVAAVMFVLAVRVGSSRRQVLTGIEQINGRLADVGRRIEFLDRMADVPFPQAVDTLRELEYEPISSAVDDFVQGPGEPLLSAEALAEYQDRIVGLLRQCSADMGDLRETIASETGALGQMIEDRQVEIARLDEDIDREQALIARQGKLEKKIASSEEAILQHNDRIDLLELAHGMVEDTCRDVYSRFNQVLRAYTGEIMPRLTEQRYAQMQIDDALHVRVFSKEKNDFAELEEFSSGTQRQMLLAVRLAMSKALIEATGRFKQFIILDEPFAFFDRERIRQTLGALTEIDRKMAQIWLISQEFDPGHDFDMHINCSLDSDVLVLNRQGTASKKGAPEPIPA